MALPGLATAVAHQSAGAEPAGAIAGAASWAARLVAAGMFWRKRRSPAGGGTAPRAGALRVVKPFIAVIAVIVTGSMLVLAIYFTLFDLQWTAFLVGVLSAAMLTMASQAARAQLAVSSGTEKLVLVRHQLARETGRREMLEQQFAEANARLHYSDKAMPAMLAFVDKDTRYLYHNRAFANWVDLPDARIDGRHMRDVLGRKVFTEVESYAFDAAAGRIVRYERTHRTPGGGLCRAAVQYLPHFDNEGQYAGFFVVITDISELPEVRMSLDALNPALAAMHAPAMPPADGVTALQPDGDAAEPGESDKSRSEGWLDATQRILAAINGDEFTLFFQRIMPLGRSASGGDHYEIFVRLLEEESSLVPPGAFFALAEEHGLLPQLDRWVFSHVLDWMVTPVGAAAVSAGSICFINIATATLSDPDFADFVEGQLRRTGVPGGAVCVEITEPDLTLHQGDAVAFARAIRESGCLIAISGYGRSRIPLETLKLFPVDFLKIDGSIVRQVVAYPVAQGKAVAICKLAKALGVRIVAEMVEDAATLVVLRELNVDFVQGFGISRPQLLTGTQAPNVAMRVDGLTDSVEMLNEVATLQSG